MFQASPASLVKNLKQAVPEKDFAFSCTACSISILHTDAEFYSCIFSSESYAFISAAFTVL